MRETELNTETTAPELTTTQYLLPLGTAKSIASLIAFADTSRGNTALALSLVKVVFNGYGIAATATDRYGVIFATLETTETTTGTIYLDASACKFITSIKVAKGHNPMITFDVINGNLTIKANDASITVRQFSGNYPDTATLMDKFQYATEAKPVSLKIDLLAKLGKIVDVDGSKIDAWNFHLGEISLGLNGQERPAPIVAKRLGFTALIQPMLKLGN